MDSVDAVGIVFFGAFWNWHESTFEGLVSEASGSTWKELLASGLAMPIVHAEIDYVKALRLSDEVTVAMSVTKLGSRSVHFHAWFRNASGGLVAEARTVNVLTS
ncbi:MAG: acyl-CoA thioesterase, partial [Acidimicrobiia bacterium]|nr:acyl-CoA thioesterase [Acidimicrobiia bacterium]